MSFPEAGIVEVFCEVHEFMRGAILVTESPFYSSVGHGSVIGAGSVVTRDIPPYSVAVGSPAKVIRRRRGAPPDQ